jgi:predicted DNA-binding transcriptional regulator AlpA
MNISDKPFLQIDEAASLLGVSKALLYKYRNKPGFPVIKRGKLFFPREELLKWWGNPANQ